MKAVFAALLMALLAFAGAEAASSRKLLQSGPVDIIIKWGWAMEVGYPNGHYPTIFANVGDTLVLQWAGQRPHNVYQVPSYACPSNFTNAPGVTLLSGNATTAGFKSLNLVTPGTIYLACGVGQHCSADGMLLQVVVGSGVAAAAPMPSISRAAIAPNTAPFGAGAPVRPAAPQTAPS